MQAKDHQDQKTAGNNNSPKKHHSPKSNPHNNNHKNHDNISPSSDYKEGSGEKQLVPVENKNAAVQDAVKDVNQAMENVRSIVGEISQAKDIDKEAGDAPGKPPAAQNNPAKATGGRPKSSWNNMVRVVRSWHRQVGRFSRQFWKGFRRHPGAVIKKLFKNQKFS